MNFPAPADVAFPAFANQAYKLLLVEDDPVHRDFFLAMMNATGGRYSVVRSVESIAKALEAIGQIRPDCIVSDLGLTDGAGLDSVKAFTAHFPEIPLIVLTGKNDSNFGQKAIAAGAQDYLVKSALEIGNLIQVVEFSIERMRLRAKEVRIRKRMYRELGHKEKVLKLTRCLHRVKSMQALGEEFKISFGSFFAAELFSLFVFDPLAKGWRLVCHNHPFWAVDTQMSLPVSLSGIMGECAYQRRLIAYRNMMASPFGSPNSHRYQMDNAICVPLLVDDRIIGMLNLNDNPADSFEDDALDAIRNLADHLSLALYNCLSHEEYLDMAHRDALTKLYNRRYLHQYLPPEMVRSLRYGIPLSVVLADIDHFKIVNDTHGHPTGDTVLVEFAAILTRNTRNCDLVFRVGGEEFLLVLPSTPGESAMLLAERIRKDWANQAMPGTAGITLRSTASFGVCELSAPADLEALLAQVDQALYQAKDMGRNICRFAQRTR